MLKKPPGTPCRELFRSTGTLTLPCLYILESVAFGLKHASTWTRGADLHNYNTRSRNTYRIQQHRTSFYEKNPIHMSQKMINSLPHHLKDIDNRVQLKKKLKDWLADKCFYDMNDFLL
ncbi:uncharacterized protein LOC120355885 [Nilaparvata lugens]|uniref:uncharacterized protein LOC120355885 n=1 Tax=Nilaparvata lugens TaxID=108931 RepID=UPI00193D4EDF|nr:uncharacterized protein LOC120355885 [Nilaparvata lugens]